jgi:L-ribulose-5-phosphate 3-epimerase
VNPASSFPTTRRDFLSTLALAGAALPLTGLAAETKSAQPFPAPSAPSSAAAPGGPTTVHVFSKPLATWSYADTAKILADCGYDGIDYTVRVPQGHVQPDKVQDDLPRAVEAAHAAGLKVEMITTDIVSARDRHTENVLRTAAKCGVKFYRLGNWSYDGKLGVQATWDKVRSALVELAALNASLGLHGAIQNHQGTRIGSPVWDLYELLKDIDPRWIGVQYDIRHATTEGGLSWPLGLRLLAPWIRCTDLKDFRWEQSPGKATVEGVPLGEGIVPFDAYFKLVRELKLSGPMSVHLEYPPFERTPQPLTPDEQRVQFTAALKKDRETLRTLMARNQVG